MDSYQFFTMMGAILSTTWILYREMKSIESSLNEQIKTQSARSDKLYEMFIALLKDGRK